MITIQYQRPPIAIHKKQTAFIDDYSTRIVVCEGGSKSGKTEGCIIWLHEQMLIKGNPSTQGLWVAPVAATAKMAMDRIWRDHIPQKYINRKLFSRNETTRTITYPNGARLFFKGADRPDLIYGEEYDFIVVDEASRMKQDAWVATVSVGTPKNAYMRVIGNIKGRKNWFYKLCRQKELEGIGYHSMTYRDNPFFDHKSAIEAKELMSEAEYNEIFENIILDDGVCPFDIQSMLANSIPKLSEKPTYVYGVDVGGVKDYTVIVGLSKDGEMTYLERYLEPDSMKNTDRIVSRVKDGAYVCIDATGKGQHISYGVREKVGGKCILFYISGNSVKGNQKADLISHLIYTTARNKIKLVKDHPEKGKEANFASEKYCWLWDEFDNFGIVSKETYTTYQAMDGTHDDGVMAVVLANHFLTVMIKGFGGGWKKAWD